MQLIRAHKSFAVLLATIVLIELAHGIEIVTLLPLLLTRQLGQGETFVGLVASVYLLVDTLLTRTPAGLLADRWGRKGPLMLSILWFSLFAFLSGFSTSYAMLFALRALFGLGLWNALLAAESLKVPLPLTALVQQMLVSLMNEGKGDLDHSGLVQFIEQMAQVEVRKPN